MRHLVRGLLLFCTVNLLAEENPSAPADDAEIARLIKQLDSEDYAERQAATAALIKVGEPARKALQEAADKSESAEVRARSGHSLKQIRLEELKRTALKLDVIFQMSRDVCDGKAKPAELEPLLDRALEAIGEVDATATRKLPVPISECKAEGVGPRGGQGNSLVVGQREITILRSFVAIVDFTANIAHAEDSVIIAWGAVDISHAANCVIIAGIDVEVSHAENCVILSGGAMQNAHTQNSTLGAAGALKAGYLSKRCALVNSRAEVDALPRGDDLFVLDVGGLILREKPINQVDLSKHLTPTFLSTQFMLFKVPGQPGEFVARVGTQLCDPAGKPLPGLDGWKLVQSSSRLAALSKDDERTIVRLGK